MILVAAHSPESMPRLMALKRQEIEDPEVLELYTRFDEAVDWRPDDARLDELADRVVGLMSRSEPWGDDPDAIIAVEVVELLDSYFVDAVPVARRLMELVEERGWSGWTNLKPTTDVHRPS